MEKESNEMRKKMNLHIHIFDFDMEVNVPVGEEQRYLEAAEMVNRKIDAYYGVFVWQRYVRLKGDMEILLMVLLDFAVREGESKSLPSERGERRAVAERVKSLWNSVISFFKRKEVCD